MSNNTNQTHQGFKITQNNIEITEKLTDKVNNIIQTCLFIWVV